jgi:apolipoprotein N-acyltransferase
VRAGHDVLVGDHYAGSAGRRRPLLRHRHRSPRQRTRHRPRLDRRKLLGALLAGVLLGLAFPPVGAWPLAVVAVAALSLLCRGATAGQGAGLGFAFGMSFFVVLLRWLHVVGWDAVVGLSALEALFLMPVGIGFAWTTGRRGWPLWQAAIWVAAEALRARVPLGGLPWGRLAFAQADAPFARLAAIGGMPLISFAVALAGCLLAAALVQLRARCLRGALLPVAILAAVGCLGWAVPLHSGGADTVTVAVVQGNVPRAGYDTAAQQQVVFANHLEATHALAAAVREGRSPHPDLVIWPENSSDLDPFEEPMVSFRITAAVDDIGAPTLIGAVLDGGPRYVRNAGIVWNPNQGPGEIYVKRHPVPFGEYLPMRRLVTKLIARFSRVPRDFQPGPRAGLLQMGSTHLGELICFEVAYDNLVHDVVRGGGRVLVVQTNNATYGHTGQPEQQLEITRLRAIETGRAVVVAATSGISAVINPAGHVVRQSKEFTREVIVRQVPLRAGRTTAMRLGAWPELVLVMLGVGSIVMCRPRNSRMPRRRRTTVVSGFIRRGPRGGT